MAMPLGITRQCSFNNKDLPFGREATMEEWESEGDKCFSNDYGSYRLLDDLSKELLDDILEVFNDHYCADCFAISKTAIGYGFYKCANE